MSTSVATAIAREMVAEYLAGVTMWVSLHTDQPTPVDPLSTMIRMADDEIQPVTWNRNGAVLSNNVMLLWSGLSSYAGARYAAITADPEGTQMLFYAELEAQDPTEMIALRAIILEPGELRIAVI